LFLSQPFP